MARSRLSITRLNVFLSVFLVQQRAATLWPLCTAVGARLPKSKLSHAYMNFSVAHISRCHYTKYTIHLLFGSLAILTFSHLVDFFLFVSTYLPPALTGLDFDYPVLFTPSRSVYLNMCVCFCSFALAGSGHSLHIRNHQRAIFKTHQAIHFFQKKIRSSKYQELEFIS